LATVSISPSFSSLIPNPGFNFQNLGYCSNPSASGWDCTKQNPYVCTSQCGTNQASGPYCACQSGVDLLLSQYPAQVRWGLPSNPGVTVGCTGIQSGFGFSGANSLTLSSLNQEFWIGRGVHFNNAIYSSGGNSGGWNLKLAVTITAAGGKSVISTFSFPMQLHETP
jgi:hypothetical protein